MDKSRLTRTKRPRHRGTTLVEMAVVFPLLLMVTLGALKYGWLFLRAQQITNAARQAARMAILPDANLDEVKAAIGFFMAGAGFKTYTLDPALVSVAGPIVTIGIRVDPATVDLLPGYLPEPASLYAAVTMAKEGTPAGPITPPP
jgi:hypothetical protein